MIVKIAIRYNELFCRHLSAMGLIDLDVMAESHGET